MIILNNSGINTLLICIISLSSCLKWDTTHIDKNEKKCNGTTDVLFINSYNNEPLCNYRFSIYSNWEELPTWVILERDSIGLISDASININHSLYNKGDTIYGYFEKKGFKDHSFRINLENCIQKVEIDPLPNEIVIKFFDENPRFQFDSIKVFISRTNLQSKKKNKEIGNEVFVFMPNDILGKLSILNYFQQPYEKISMKIEVNYLSNKVTHKYNLYFQSNTKTIIQIP
jgi:hypothetical protein